jgi:hypothetical protein
VRMRLLLLKQDEVTGLEGELTRQDYNDDKNEKNLWPGVRGMDRNEERTKIIQRLEAELNAYSKF